MICAFKTQLFPNNKCRDYNASINLENYTARSAGIYAVGDDSAAPAVNRLCLPRLSLPPHPKARCKQPR